MIHVSDQLFLTGHNLRVLFVVVGKTENSVDNPVINNGLTIKLKNVIQLTERRMGDISRHLQHFKYEQRQNVFKNLEFIKYYGI